MNQEQQILMAILEEMRHLRQSVEQQSILSAHASRAQEYAIVYERYRHLMPAVNGLGGAADIANLWVTLRGNEGWQDHMSADQLGLLLCRDERVTFDLPEGRSADVPAGFLEEVLSRLPRLERCSVRGLRCATDFSQLQSVPSPFPALRSLDLQETAVTDADLLYLAQLAPALHSVNVSNCPNVTSGGIDAVRARRPTLLMTPATREAMQLEAAQRELDKKLMDFTSPESEAEYERLSELYGRHIFGFEKEDRLDAQLLALWTAIGGAGGWRRQLRPAQLTLLLSKLTNVSASCLQGREEHFISAKNNRMTATTVPEAEIVGFVTQVIARLPALRMLKVYDCHRWPVDFAAMRGELARPFRALWYCHARHTPYSVADLIDFARRVPALMDRELIVESNRLPPDTVERRVIEDCLNKLAFAS